MELNQKKFRSIVLFIKNIEKHFSMCTIATAIAEPFGEQHTKLWELRQAAQSLVS